MVPVFTFRGVRGDFMLDFVLHGESCPVTVGDYLRLPDGRTFCVECLFPARFVEVDPDGVPQDDSVRNLYPAD